MQVHISSLILPVAFWIFGFLFLFRIRYCRKTYKKSERYPSVSIIIPARGEEKSLPILLSSLRNQVPLADEIIVVVEEWDAGTRHVAEGESVTTLISAPRPKGWVGKPWACYQGAQAARGDILIFLDADTKLGEGGLRHIADACVESKGAVTVQPYHAVVKPYEQFSGIFNIIGMAGMGTFTVLGKSVKPVGLFGPCVAIAREQYFQTGGHSSVRGEVVEDLAFGEKLKKAGIPIECFGGKGTISFRMYPNGLRDLVDGWSKGFATGAVKTSIPILVATILWIGGGISTTKYFIEAIWNTNLQAAVIWGTVYIAYAAQIYWMLMRLGKFKIYISLFYPVALLFFILVFVYSVFLIFIKRRVRWKGAEINLKDKEVA